MTAGSKCGCCCSEWGGRGGFYSEIRVRSECDSDLSATSVGIFRMERSKEEMNESCCGQLTHNGGMDTGKRKLGHVVWCSNMHAHEFTTPEEQLSCFPSSQRNAEWDSRSVSRALSPVTSIWILFHPFPFPPRPGNFPACVVLVTEEAQACFFC